MPTSVLLKVYRGDELVRTEQFTREIIKVGRLSSAHLCLEDERISRIHAVIEVASDGRVSIVDMGSTEGTFVNGKRVSKGPLRQGDEIRLGGLRVVLAGVGDELSAPEGAAFDVQLTSSVDIPLPTPAPVNGAAAFRDARDRETVAHPAIDGAVRQQYAQVAAAAVAAPVSAAAAPLMPDEIPTPAPIRGRSSLAEAVPAPVRAAAPAPAPQRQRRTVMAVARPVDEEPVAPGAPSLGVELRLLWGDTLLDAGTFVEPEKPVLIGETPACTFRVSAPTLPSGQFPILRFDHQDYRFLFGHGMAGGVQPDVREPKILTFAELVKTRQAVPDSEGAYSVPIPRAGAVRADLGSGLRVEARYRRPPKLATVPWWHTVDYRYLNLLLVLLFLLGGFIVASWTTTRDIDLVQDDLARGQAKMVKFIMKPPELQKPNKYLEKLQRDMKKDPGELAERHKGTEGQMGKKDAPKTSGRSAPRAIDPNAKDLVKHSGLLAALNKGRGAGGLSTIMGQGGLGGDLKGAIGNIYGKNVGDSYGVGGLGLKGSGVGGGGQGDTIGIGGVGTKGRGGGMGGYGSGVGGMGGKRDRDVAIASGETKVLGAIDKELVRKVIRDHESQVRYCYAQQLTLDPKLAGKVSIKWQINADGSASLTQVDPSAPIDNPRMMSVARCIMSRIETWQFPKPKGGGYAIITYPWILRSSGSASAG